MKRKKKQNKNDRIFNGIIATIVIFSVLLIGYNIKIIFFPSQTNIQQIQQSAMQVSTMSKMSMTSFDKELARKMMDKDGDGKCDACGMPVEQCIESGQLQCSMDTFSKIGILDTTKKTAHFHADFKVFRNNQEIDFNKPEYFVKSMFIHVENDSEGDSGKVLHMHATGVPLWIFFESISMKLSNSTEVYVNGKLEPEGLNYVFKDLDKILITDADGDINQQLASITDYAKNHKVER